MCFFKKKKKENKTFQDWNNNANNFGFNDRASKLEGDFQKTSNNKTSDGQDSNAQNSNTQNK